MHVALIDSLFNASIALNEMPRSFRMHLEGDAIDQFQFFVSKFACRE
jgi:hypothetical protein